MRCMASWSRPGGARSAQEPPKACKRKLHRLCRRCKCSCCRLVPCSAAATRGAITSGTSLSPSLDRLLAWLCSAGQAVQRVFGRAGFHGLDKDRGGHYVKDRPRRSMERSFGTGASPPWRCCAVWPPACMVVQTVCSRNTSSSGGTRTAWEAAGPQVSSI